MFFWSSKEFDPKTGKIVEKMVRFIWLNQVKQHFMH